MAIDVKNRKLAWGAALAGVAVIVAVSSSGMSSELDAVPSGQQAMAMDQQRSATGYNADTQAPSPGFQQVQYDPQDGGGAQGVGRQGEAEQALEGLAQIRQQQCQMGNQLACEALPTIPGIRNQLAEASRACQSGDCNAYNSLAQRIFTAYSESAAVMRQGEQGMAQMNAWRAQMNRNAANSMANLQAQAARGQAAHEARQQSYAAQNRAWQAGQDSIDRNHGRAVDRIYEGTTMNGGGVQSRIDDGYVGYTDGYGNVISVLEGRQPPDGWQKMDPAYAPPR